MGVTSGGLIPSALVVSQWVHTELPSRSWCCVMFKQAFTNPWWIFVHMQLVHHFFMVKAIQSFFFFLFGQPWATVHFFSRHSSFHSPNNEKCRNQSTGYLLTKFPQKDAQLKLTNCTAFRSLYIKGLSWLASFISVMVDISLSNISIISGISRCTLLFCLICFYFK